jgi:hypothetical protein
MGKKGKILFFEKPVRFLSSSEYPDCSKTGAMIMQTPNDPMKQLYKNLAEREKGYRARALRLFPHVCASCGRSFSGQKLKELTVHHKDHNHDNNPPDGSNWELLCIYCHDHEHEKHKMKGYASASSETPSVGTFAAFEGLDALFEEQKKES